MSGKANEPSLPLLTARSRIATNACRRTTKAPSTSRIAPQQHLLNSTLLNSNRVVATC